MMRLFAACMALALGACAHSQHVEPPEPVIRTVEVNVPVPVPCPALARLGPEPDYADSDAAITAAPDLFAVAKLYAAGRLQRIQRLGAYTAARAACSF